MALSATDEAGIEVDALAIRSDGQTVALHAEPRGLLGARLVTTTDQVIVVDSHPALTDLFNQGFHQTLLLRGLLDAQHNAARLFASGIRSIDLRVQRDADAITAALLAAGILVTANNAPVARPAPEPSAPAPAAAPVLGDSVEEERDGQAVIYQAGPVAFVVSLRDDGQTTRTLIVRAKGRSWNHDHDLAAAVSRDRAAKNIAKQVGWPVADVVAHLVRLLQLVQAHEAKRDAMPVAPISAADRKVGLAFLDAPDHLDLTCADYTALGWPGEHHAKQVLHLVGISRLLASIVALLLLAVTGHAIGPDGGWTSTDGPIPAIAPAPTPLPAPPIVGPTDEDAAKLACICITVLRQTHPPVFSAALAYIVSHSAGDSYDAYGGRTIYAADGTTVRGTSSYGMRYGYTGRPFDTVTRLGYYRYRWYHASLGRFISRDPAGYIDGGNLYQYVRGNPLWYIDPWGLGATDESVRMESARAALLSSGMDPGAVAGMMGSFRGTDQAEAMLADIQRAQSGNGSQGSSGIDFTSPEMQAMMNGISEAQSQLTNITPTGYSASQLAQQQDYQRSYNNLANAQVDIPLGIGPDRSRSRRYYTVQNRSDVARLARGGAPWPTGTQGGAVKSHFGPGLYTWKNRADAERYLALKSRRTNERLHILSVECPDEVYSFINKANLSEMPSAQQEQWRQRFDELYGGQSNHGLQMITAPVGTNFGNEVYFNPATVQVMNLQVVE